MAEAAAGTFCPYVGLQPFTAEQQEYFFGREREQRIIAANLFAAPLTILYGPSAVGKSSVLQAGVVPRLSAEPHTAVLYFATWQGEDYLAQLKKACRAAVESAHGLSIDVDDRLPLDEWILAAQETVRGTLLLIFDQFEEYLLYHAENDEKAFDGELARLVNRPEVRANLLIGLREDSLSRLNRFSKRIPNLMGNTLQLRRMTPEAARRAVVGPIEQFNRRFPSERPVRIEEPLVTRVLEEVSTEKVAPSLSGGVAGVQSGEDRGLVETAFLQLVLTELWRAAEIRDGARVLSQSTLDRLGGAKAIVRRHVDVELGRLSKEGRATAVRLFQHLVTPSGAKYALRTEDLIGIAAYPAERVIPVLAALTAARLLRRIDPPERYEIFHDAFAVALLEWRQDYLQHRRQRAGVMRAAAAAVAVAAIAGTAVYVVHERRDATQTRLNLQVANLRADRGTQATEAAREAQAAAENLAREAELRLEAGQLALEADRAKLNGEAQKATELQAQQQAKEQSANAARAEAVRQSAESRTKLAAAEASQSRVEDLTKYAKAQGITVLGSSQNAPPAAAAAPPKSEPAPVAPPPVDASRPPLTTKPPGGGDYKETYRQAIEAKNQNRWRDAATLFRAALAQNATESTERINISGPGNVEPYVPHYYLGVVLKNLNDCPGALKEWEDSEREGAIQHTSLYKALQQNRAACTGKS